MGFVPERTAYKLMFSDPKYDGLEVTMTSSTVGELLDSTLVNVSGLDVAALEEAAQRNDAAAIAKHVALISGTITSVYETFARHLVRWNVDYPDGTPVPPTLEGIKSQDDTFIKDVLAAWRAATTEVSTNLGPTSTVGRQSVEASLPMEPSSPNPPN